MRKIKIHSPRNLFRLLKLIGITRSLSLPLYIGKNRHLKTVLRFLKSGKIVQVEGDWVAIYGNQKVLMNHLKGDDFFLLENLKTFESAGSVITIERFTPARGADWSKTETWGGKAESKRRCREFSAWVE